MNLLEKKYKTEKALQAVIDGYYKDCEGEVLKNDDGEIVKDKNGLPIIVGNRQPTSSGLAYALGFVNRKSLFDCRKKGKYKEVIERAMLYLEMKTEERLFDKDGSRGAQFSLSNNFGWRDGVENAAETVAAAVKIVYDIPRVAEEEKGDNG